MATVLTLIFGWTLISPLIYGGGRAGFGDIPFLGAGALYSSPDFAPLLLRKQYMQKKIEIYEKGW